LHGHGRYRLFARAAKQIMKAKSTVMLLALESKALSDK
jgi:hypothetical protein